ncbi:TonB-dependent receptor [Edaphobacter aggregans]|uniref:TonB-dependent receptor n=1 Tax=Edaphobacter aggregans TaxID=570835 RepID=UPI0005594EC2|nr:carboxypeptidase regulatory-like domain-containing protein [Edaphobacter aggregans]
MRRYRYYTAVMAMLCLFSGWLCAQNVTGAVSGIVTDPSGAVISGATVVVHNVGTGVDTMATTNDVGLYSARFLPIGQYQVTVSAPGFSTAKFTPFTLEINQTAKFDAKLQLGNLTTVADVSAAVAPILNTNDSSLGISLSTNEIANIPLNGRNFSSVTLFQPGAIATDPQGMTGNNAIERSTFNNGVASINGNRNQANYYTLDGADLNEPQNNLIAYNPAPDAIAEVRVISANAPATYGNANGGAVVSVLKSGANQFHGSAYAFLQNQNLNANSWSNKHANPIIAINPYTQTMFGGTFGGPLKKDKLFFFVDYEGARSHTGGLQQASVLPSAMRNGDFSSLLRATDPIQLYDTQNGFSPYNNNQIPVVNPVAKYLFAHPEFYPLENATPTDGLLQNNFQGPQRKFVRNDQGDAKLDWSQSQSNKFTVFYSQSNAGDTQTSLIPIFFPPQNVYPTKLGGGSWIHTFTPTIVNEARFGFTRVRWDNSVPTDPSGAFGLNGNATVGIPFGAQAYPGFSGQGLGNNASFIGANANIQVLRDNTFNYYDNLTWQRGRHLLSIGIQATRYQQNYINSSNYGFLGEFDYTGAFTGLPGGNGYGPADFVLDRVAESKLGSSIGLVGNRQWRTAGYIQDDWKATDNLTVNIGLRYEFDQPWYEVNNKTANVDLSTGTVEYAGSIPAGAPAGSKLCPTRACYNANYAQWMPRIGFALQVTPRMVIRGGYGASSFFEGNAGNQRLTSSPPFAQGSDLVATKPSQGNPGSPFRIEDGFTPQFSATSQYSVWPQNIQPAYIHQYSLTTEFALSNTTSLTVGYLGESGHHLIDYRNANQLTQAQAQIIAALPDGASIPAVAQAPYASLVGQNGALLVTESAAMMNYNGGQLTVRHHADRGFEYTVNYTYAKAMTNSAGNYGQPGISGSTGAFQDAYNPQADYAPSGQDVRHNLNAVGVYALPFGRDQLYGTHMNRVLDLVAGGWKISSSVIAFTGLPITIQAPNVSNTNNNFSTARANHYRKLIIRNRSIDNWWGTDPSAVPCNGPDNGICAYGVAAPNTFGTASTNSERVPGFAQIDASAFKDFHITEKHLIGFRVDAFNLFNIASYQNPDSSVTDANFGQITNTRSKERNLQLNLHYAF